VVFIVPEFPRGNRNLFLSVNAFDIPRRVIILRYAVPQIRGFLHTVAVVVILYGRIAIIASFEHVDQDLYKITIKQDYYLEEILKADFSSADEMDDFFNQKMFFGL